MLNNLALLVLYYSLNLPCLVQFKLYTVQCTFHVDDVAARRGPKEGRSIRVRMRTIWRASLVDFAERSTQVPTLRWTPEPT